MVVLMAVAGCKSGSSPSPVTEKSIVQKVEDGGISEADLKRADAAGLQLWFGKHADMAQSIAA